MRILEGSSQSADGARAVREACAGWGDAPDFCLAFHSTSQNPADVAAALARELPESLVIGASTAGEWRTGGHQRGSLALLGVRDPDARWAVAEIPDVQAFDPPACRALGARLRGELGLREDDLRPDRHLLILLIDGLSRAEERVVALLDEAFPGASMIGGSAGDDNRLEATWVMARGRAWRGGAVVALMERDAPFRLFKHQHFLPGGEELVVTAVAGGGRIVRRLDGKPAIERYAEVVGVPPEALDARIFAQRPLVYRQGNECYLRAVGRFDAQGALHFHSAMEEGMVLELGRHEPMIGALREEMARLAAGGKAEWMLLFNCLHRRIEAEAEGVAGQAADALAGVARHVIGFDTYGEQWQGFHMNQTMVGALFDARDDG